MCVQQSWQTVAWLSLVLSRLVSAGVEPFSVFPETPKQMPLGVAPPGPAWAVFLGMVGNHFSSLGFRLPSVHRGAAVHCWLCREAGTVVLRGGAEGQGLPTSPSKGVPPELARANPSWVLPSKQWRGLEAWGWPSLLWCLLPLLPDRQRWGPRVPPGPALQGRWSTCHLREQRAR